MSLVKESVNLGSLKFLFEADDSGRAAGDSELSQKEKKDIVAFKKNVLTLVKQTEKVLSTNKMVETSPLFGFAAKKLLTLVNNEEEGSMLLFTLAAQSIESIAGIAGAFNTSYQALDLVTEPIKVYPYKEKSASPNVLFSNEEDIKKIVENGFKSHPDFFKSMFKPFKNFFSNVEKGYAATESKKYVVDHFKHLPPLFSDLEQKETLNELNKAALGGTAAGAGLGFAVGGPIGALIGAGLGAIGAGAGNNMVKYYQTISKGAAVSAKGSVITYMPLFNNQPIHKKIAEDLLSGNMTVENTLTIEKELKGLLLRYVQAVPKRKASETLRGVDSPGNTDESGATDGDENSQASKIAAVVKSADISREERRDVVSSLRGFSIDDSLVRAISSILGAPSNPSAITAAAGGLSERDKELISLIIKGLKNDKSPDEVVTAAVESVIDYLDDDHISNKEEVNNKIEDVAGLDAIEVVKKLLSSNERLRVALGFDNKVASESLVHFSPPLLERGKWVKFLFEDLSDDKRSSIDYAIDQITKEIKIINDKASDDEILEIVKLILKGTKGAKAKKKAAPDRAADKAQYLENDKMQRAAGILKNEQIIENDVDKLTISNQIIASILLGEKLDEEKIRKFLKTKKTSYVEINTTSLQDFITKGDAATKATWDSALEKIEKLDEEVKKEEKVKADSDKSDDENENKYFDTVKGNRVKEKTKKEIISAASKLSGLLESIPDSVGLRVQTGSLIDKTIVKVKNPKITPDWITARDEIKELTPVDDTFADGLLDNLKTKVLDIKEIFKVKDKDKVKVAKEALVTDYHDLVNQLLRRLKKTSAFLDDLSKKVKKKDFDASTLGGIYKKVYDGFTSKYLELINNRVLALIKVANLSLKSENQIDNVQLVEGVSRRQNLLSVKSAMGFRSNIKISKKTINEISKRNSYDDSLVIERWQHLAGIIK